MKGVTIVLAFLQKYWFYIVAFFAIVFIWRKLFVGSSKVVHEYKDGGGATITKQEASALAESLWVAMESFGTTESLIEEVYNQICYNSDNLKLVYNAFGVRPYSQFGSAWWSWIPTTDLDLKQWLRTELNPDTFAKWLSLFNLAGIK